jgi:hypothetical protein
MRVWIAQCLCPSRHAIMANAGEVDNEQEAAAEIQQPLREAIEEGLKIGAMNPWCGLCHAPADSWHYEVGRTRFRSMAEALPSLQKNEIEQAITRAAFGDMPQETKH